MEDLHNISVDWFNNYFLSFKVDSEQLQRNLAIKKEHSLRVVENSLKLTEKLEWNDNDRQIAFAAALFHDIGRFRQLLEFGTFDDSKSLNHAELSVEILKENNLPVNLISEAKEIVYKTILNHNKLKVDDGLSRDELKHVNLLRDADKLDILKVLSEYYASRSNQPNHTLTWELPRGIAVNPEIVNEVLAGKTVSKKYVQSEIDVKIMQLSWVYDLNYKPAFEILARNRYLETIFNTLPKNDTIFEIYRKIKVYLENRLLMGSVVNRSIAVKI